MNVVCGLAGFVLLVVILLDAFEALVHPRRLTGKFRPTRVFYRSFWRPWSAIGRHIGKKRRRESFLGAFGPLSLLVLFALWACGLLFAFALLQWANHTPLHLEQDTHANFFTYLYMSGVTIFTVGFGDVLATSTFGRALSVAEAGLGLGFFAMVVGYLPILYQAFSRREVAISLMDARAGSPPTAAELLIRYSRMDKAKHLEPFLQSWEQWSAELLESLLSFPALGFYRSQHDNQSWLAALTTVLDTCALVLAGISDVDAHQAQLTFAISRHAAVDLTFIYNTQPLVPDADRLPPVRLRELRDRVSESGLSMDESESAAGQLTGLRQMYEPFVNALSIHFQMELPEFLSDQRRLDNWQTSTWKSGSKSKKHFG